MKITLKGFIEVPESDLEVVLEELEIHKQLTQSEPGCITFKVIQSKNNPTRFNVYEEFESREDFEYHQQRVRSSNWGVVSKNCKRSYEITSG